MHYFEARLKKSPVTECHAAVATEENTRLIGYIVKPELVEQAMAVIQAAELVSLTEPFPDGRWASMDDLKAALNAMDKGN